MVNARFGNHFKWPQLHGYRISGVIDMAQGNGFGDQFFVYLVVLNQSQTALPDVAFPDTGVTGDLTISGNDPDFEYTFRDIELSRVLSQGSRRQRQQVVEFRYFLTPERTDEILQLSHGGEQKVRSDNRLKDQYLLNLGGDAQTNEELLFASVITTRAAQHLAQFAKYRNSDWSWVQVLADFDRRHRNGGKPGFDISFAQFSQTVDVTTGVYLACEEAWGAAVKWPGIDLGAQILGGDAEVRPPTAQLRLPVPSLQVAHEHYVNPSAFERDMAPAVEMGSLVLRDNDRTSFYKTKLC